MEGRRVEPEVKNLEKPGDYFPAYQDDGKTIKCLWFALPDGSAQWCRIAAKGGGSGTEPEWTITEDDQGRVTVDPSIDYPRLWHGHLRGGVWSTAGG